MVAQICHLLALCLLIAVGVSLGLGPFYYLGLAAVAALLGYENSIVHADDLSRVNVAFFTLNGVISVVFLAGVRPDAPPGAHAGRPLRRPPPPLRRAGGARRGQPDARAG